MNMQLILDAEFQLISHFNLIPGTLHFNAPTNLRMIDHTYEKIGLCILLYSGFVRLRENLKNLEKGTFLKQIRENLENSGNFPTIFTTSGKTQGILFCQISLIK